jgi:hypothetical protein
MRQEFAKIKNSSGLVRDLSTSAILNADVSAIKKHEKIKNDILRERRREEEIQQLKSDVGEIKELLLKIIDRK